MDRLLGLERVRRRRRGEPRTHARDRARGAPLHVLG